MPAWRYTNPELVTRESRVPTPKSRRVTRESRIPNPKSRARVTRESRIPNPKSRARVTRESRIPNPKSRVANPQSRIPNPESPEPAIARELHACPHRPFARRGCIAEDIERVHDGPIRVGRRRRQRGNQAAEHRPRVGISALRPVQGREANARLGRPRHLRQL